jgi:hypothetical protein
MENVATYSEARSEYTKQLASFVVPALVGWFQSMWARNASDKQRCLALFQGDCEEIARWNTDRVHDEVRALIERTGCDYMEELMTAVFVAHTKVLTAVRLSTKQKKLSITVPKLDHFVHRVFRETARAFWKTPFLFMEGNNVVERQKNVLQIEALATESITTAVRSLLPVKQILKDYLEDDEEDEVVEAEERGPVTPVVRPSEEAKEEEVAVTVEEKAPAPKVEEAKEEVKEPVKQEKKEEAPAVAPAVVKIDTEPAVSFSDYDEVFSKSSAPELVHVPRLEDDDDGPSDGLLKIDESSSRSIGDDDVEDLEAPKPKAKPTPVPALPPKEESLDSDIVVLE